MPEFKVHSFIVKLWLEDADHETKTVAWRGYITHVPSGERRYLLDLGDIQRFVKRYVGEISTETTFVSRVSRRLKSLMRKNR